MEPTKRKLLKSKTLNLSELNYHRAKPKFFKKSATLSFEDVKQDITAKKSPPSENFVDNSITSYLSLFKDYLLLINSRSEEINGILKTKNKVPIKSKRKLLIFDLDETLVYTDPDKMKSTIRPHTDEMLEALSAHYDIAVWTAAEKHYADQIIDGLVDPLGKFILMRLYREDCVQITDEICIKDFRVLEGIDMKRVVLIDNQLLSFATNLENGFLCDSFNGSMADVELSSIKDFFLNYKDEDDLQKLLCNMFHLKDTIEAIIKS